MAFTSATTDIAVNRKKNIMQHWKQNLMIFFLIIYINFNVYL